MFFDLLNSVLRRYLKTREKRVERIRKNPHDVQNRVFEYLIQQGKNTSFGKEHGFSEISCIEDFQKKVPVRSYEDFSVYTNRILNGEKNVSWPSKISWMSKSSGTTGARSKFLPVSGESLRGCHFRGGFDSMTSYYQNYSDARIYSGKAIIMAGSWEQGEVLKHGDVSAIMMMNTPFVLDAIRIPSRALSLIPDFEEKLDAMLEHCLGKDVRAIAGVPTWTLVLFEKILQKTGKKHIHEVWPHLEAYFHGAVNFAPYRNQFQTLLPNKPMRYLEVYNAAEGFFAWQDTPDNENGMLLALDHGIFFEFLPLDQLGVTENQKTCLLSEVEVGKNYAVIISTNGGLWRYNTGDTVLFLSVDPFRVRVSGRTKHFINAFGEEVMVHNTDAAIKKACEMTSSFLSDYTVAPVFLTQGEKGCHEWIIEFEKEPEDREFFVKILDEELQNVNSDYQAKRFKDLALTLPKIHIVPEGTFGTWLKSKGKFGAQHKVPRLSNDRKIVEEILKDLHF